MKGTKESQGPNAGLVFNDLKGWVLLTPNIPQFVFPWVICVGKDYFSVVVKRG